MVTGVRPHPPLVCPPRSRKTPSLTPHPLCPPRRGSPLRSPAKPCAT